MTDKPTMTLGALIQQLQEMAEKHGADVGVFIHDADTDWALKLFPEDAVRFGQNDYGDGVEGAVMIQSAGYYG